MWTKEEITFLKENYPTKGKIWSCKKLKKTEGSVRSKAAQLGLKLDKNSPFFKEFQHKAKLSKIGVKRPEHSLLMKKKYLDGDIKPPSSKTHGLSRTKAYRILKGMMSRCNNPKNDSYIYYGGRGIKVCLEWQKIEVFKEWFDANYKQGLTIERINYDGDYTPQNCTFISPKEQARNKRSTILTKEKVNIIRNMYLNGISQIQISKILGISYKNIHCIIKNKTWV